jgi:molecular chaperone DnaK (HSP70)
VYEGDNPKASKNVLLGDFTVIGPRTYQPKEMTVRVKMYVNQHGMVKVEAKPVGQLKRDVQQQGAAGTATGSAELTVDRRDTTGLTVDAVQLREQLTQYIAAVTEEAAKARLRRQLALRCKKLEKMGLAHLIPDHDSSSSSSTVLQQDLDEIDQHIANAEADAKADTVEERPPAKRSAAVPADGDSAEQEKKPKAE